MLFQYTYSVDVLQWHSNEQSIIIWSHVLS